MMFWLDCKGVIVALDCGQFPSVPSAHVHQVLVNKHFWQKNGGRNLFWEKKASGCLMDADRKLHFLQQSFAGQSLNDKWFLLLDYMVFLDLEMEKRFKLKLV